MNKPFVITAIVLVAVIMGIGAISPMILQAEAYTGATLPEEACDALRAAPIVNPPILHILTDHCDLPDPPS